MSQTANEQAEEALLFRDDSLRSDKAISGPLSVNKQHVFQLKDWPQLQKRSYDMLALNYLPHILKIPEIVQSTGI